MAAGSASQGTPVDATREFSLINLDAMPAVQEMGNPATAGLTVRLLDSGGVRLADYAMPIAGFRYASQEASRMMGKPGSEGTGWACP